MRNFAGIGGCSFRTESHRRTPDNAVPFRLQVVCLALRWLTFCFAGSASPSLARRSAFSFALLTSAALPAATCSAQAFSLCFVWCSCFLKTASARARPSSDRLLILISSQIADCGREVQVGTGRGDDGPAGEHQIGIRGGSFQ